MCGCTNVTNLCSTRNWKCNLGKVFINFLASNLTKMKKNLKPIFHLISGSIPDPSLVCSANKICRYTDKLVLLTTRIPAYKKTKVGDCSMYNNALFYFYLYICSRYIMNS